MYFFFTDFLNQYNTQYITIIKNIIPLDNFAHSPQN